jgi:hypothetical protein
MDTISYLRNSTQTTTHAIVSTSKFMHQILAPLPGKSLSVSAINCTSVEIECTCTIYSIICVLALNSTHLRRSMPLLTVPQCIVCSIASLFRSSTLAETAIFELLTIDRTSLRLSTSLHYAPTNPRQLCV